MKISNKKVFGLMSAVFGVALVLGAVASACKDSGLVMLLKASSSVKGKHYAAVMPTATTQGIREYWTDCVGGAPVFEEPAYETQDATLTSDQVNAILANQKDSRIIPTLNRIQNAVNKKVDGAMPRDYTFVNDAMGYTYLDADTKALITGADAELITAAKATWDQQFFVIYDAGKDNLPGKDQTFVTLAKAYDNDYGDVVEINTTQGSSGQTSELYVYGLNPSGITYDEKDIINFSIYSPFPEMAKTSQTYFVGPYPTAKKINGTPSGWVTISEYGITLNSNECVKIQFNSAISLQRYVNGSIDPYEGTYKLTSIIGERKDAAEGAAVLSSRSTFVDNKTWANDNAAISLVSTDYGLANQIDIANKTTVFEAKWSEVSLARIAKYKYVVAYVYSPLNLGDAVFFAQQDWRVRSMNVPGLPTDSDNGARADTAAGTRKLPQGWNQIIISASQFTTGNLNPEGSIFFSIWNSTTGEEKGWKVSSLFGYNDLNNLSFGLEIESSSGYKGVGTVSAGTLDELKTDNVFKINVQSHNTADRFGANMLKNINLKGYTEIKFYVKPSVAISFAPYYDKVASAWWPFVAQQTPACAANTVSEFTYLTSALGASFDASYLRLGLLFIKAGGLAGAEITVGYQFI